MPNISSAIISSNESIQSAEDWKQSVRAASVSAGDLSIDFAAGKVVDGVTLVVGDPILVKDQADGSENGIRIVQESGIPLRASGSVSSGLTVFVSEGTANAGKHCVLTTADPIVLGVTSLVFETIVALTLPHAIGGSSHTASTLSTLNSKISDATLDDSSASRTPTAHALGGAEHTADTLANLNSKVSDATLIDTGDSRLSDARTPTSHAVAGAEHSASTLASLNSKVSDATLIDTGDSRLSDARTPTSHDLGGAEHAADTLANLNSKVSDATLDDSSATRTPSSHGFAGAEHSSSTLAAVNGKISDATLIDTGDSRLSDARTPTAHALGGAEHTADTLANLNSKVSDATLIDTADSRLSDSRTPTAHKDTHKSGGSDAFAATDLLEALIKRIREGGGADLVFGTIADGQFIKRFGATMVGSAIPLPQSFEAKASSSTTRSSSSFALLSGMALTPGAGKYIAMFTGEFDSSVAEEESLEIQMFVGGSAVANTIREAASIIADQEFETSVIAVVSPGASDAVEIRWRSVGGSTFRATNRGLVLVEVA